MKILEDVDVDEVSPVRRAANKRRFVLKEDADVDSEIQDIMQVAAPFEGAMLDGLRAAGADETVQKASVAAIRLLKGVEDELPEPLREVVEKLGNEMYPVRNPPLNSTTTEPNDPENELIGSATEGGELPTWKADSSAMDDDDDDDDDDVAKAFAEKSAVAKRTFSAEQRRNAASSGAAMPGGRYPIENRGDLSNAIHAVGRGKGSHAAIRAHIRSRAKALGATDMLPDSYKVGKADEEETLVRKVLKALRGAQDEHDTPADEDGDVAVPDKDDSVSKSDDEEGGTVETPPTVPVLKEDGTWDLDGVPDEHRKMMEPVMKAQEILIDQLRDTRERLQKSEDERRLQEFVMKAETDYTALAVGNDLAPILKEASEKLSDEGLERFESLLKAANAQVETGSLFQELGRTALPEENPNDAWSRLEKAAEAIVEKSDDLSMTKEQAIDRLMKTAEGQKIYADYMANEGRQAMAHNAIGYGGGMS